MTTNRPHRARVSPVLAVVALAIGIAAMVRQQPTIARAATGGASGDVTLNVVQSSADGSVRVAGSQRTVARPTASTTADVAVDLDVTRQSLYGLGATLTESSAVLLMGLPAEQRQAVLTELFDPQHTGLSVLRLVIGPSDFSLTQETLDDSATPDPDLTHFSLARDEASVIPVVRQILAINPNIRLIASPWTAPAWMKAPENVRYGVLLTQYEDAYARYLVKYLTGFRDHGITIDDLTVQNEPAALQTTYPSMLMNATQQARLVHDDLGPAMRDAGLATRVLTWDHNWCDAVPPGGCSGTGTATYPLDVLAMASGDATFAGTAFHCYGGDQAAANESMHAAWPELEIWETECSGGTWQGSRTEAFRSTVQLVLNDRNHWSNATLLWNLALDPSGGPHLGGCDTCRGVVTIDDANDTWVPELERDVLATIGRFSPAGSKVLASTVAGGSGLLASAVCSPDRRPAVVVWNPGDARTVTIGFGATVLPVSVDAASLTAVQAPDDLRCAPGEIVSPPLSTTGGTTSTTDGTPSASSSTTPTPPKSGAGTSSNLPATSAPAARTVTAMPTYTG
jgi:glucosylceramidase